MRSARSLAALLGCLSVVAAVTAAAPQAVAVPASSTVAAPAAAAVSRPAGRALLTAGPGRAAPSVGSALTPPAAAAVTATFKVTYHGFTAEAKAAFQRAVQVWATRVSSPVPITVDATFTPLGPGILGSAGAGTIWRDFSGAPKAGTWYVDALANKLHGSQLAASPDIVAEFSSSFSNWHFGSTAAPAGTYDFTTVVAHELGHGLGFLGAGNVAGGRGTVRFQGASPALPVIYDRFTENGAGKSLLSYPDKSTTLAGVLQSNSVFFDSAQVRKSNAGNRAKLYAPATWQSGSSYSHLDEATYPAGNANSLMTPVLGKAETMRNPGPITLALFGTLGW
ncbi:MAG TPA: hypothetical protein VFJ97_04370 [Dermatophilaceae bacterium]|nr:hypothetical protein [Dermatophilaceae bacterium]